MLCLRPMDTLLTLCLGSVEAPLTLIVRWRDINIKHIANKGIQYFDYAQKP